MTDSLRNKYNFWQTCFTNSLRNADRECLQVDTMDESWFLFVNLANFEVQPDRSSVKGSLGNTALNYVTRAKKLHLHLKRLRLRSWIISMMHYSTGASYGVGECSSQSKLHETRMEYPPRKENFKNFWRILAVNLSTASGQLLEYHRVRWFQQIVYFCNSWFEICACIEIILLLRVQINNSWLLYQFHYLLLYCRYLCKFVFL